MLSQNNLLFAFAVIWFNLERSKAFAVIWFNLERSKARFVYLLVGCLTSQQHASVSQGQICSDNLTCCHTKIKVADQTFHLTQSQYADTRPTGPSTDPIMRSPGRVATWVPVFKSLVWLDPQKIRRKRDSNPWSSALKADALTIRPTRRSLN